MTATPSLVLRGGESVLHFAGGPVTLHRPDKEHHIPLAAISFVHAEGSSLAIVLTASGANEPTIYRVTGVDEAAALAFGEAVTAALPADPAPDGAALVTTRTPGPPEPAEAPAAPGVPWKPVAVTVLLLALAVFAVFSVIAVAAARG